MVQHPATPAPTLHASHHFCISRLSFSACCRNAGCSALGFCSRYERGGGPALASASGPDASGADSRRAERMLLMDHAPTRTAMAEAKMGVLRDF